MGGFSYVLSLRAMSQMADLMNDRTASARYGSLATKATAEFHSIFWNAGQQRYGGDPGAIQSLSLPALDIGAPPTAALHSTVVKTLHECYTAMTHPKMTSSGGYPSVGRSLAKKSVIIV